MPAPLYGADDPRRCSGNSVSEVLDKFRKNYDRIMSLPQETKEERNFAIVYGLQRKKNQSEFTRHQSDHSAKPHIPTSLKLTRACVITAHAMALSVMTEEFTMRGLAYNPGILPAEMIIRQRVKPMPSREELLKRNSFGSVNDNKYLNAMLRSGKNETNVTN